MQHIVKGFEKFQREVFPQRRELFSRLAIGQNPSTLFISCSDSRMVPELITQQEPGELFVIRNAGNIIPPYGPEPGGVSASIEYAIAVLGVSDLIICGHSNCGAMKAILSGLKPGQMPAVEQWIKYSDAARAVVRKATYQSDECRLQGLIEENIIAQLNNVRTHPCVTLALRECKLRLHGWVYDIATGQIITYSDAGRKFVPLTVQSDL
ncbi:TPA: carbonic anhydrase [Klebsiella pneumoniae]